MSENESTEQIIIALEKRVTKLESVLLSTHDVHSVVAKTKKSSAREFLITKNLKAETQKGLALGYFLEHVDGQSSFNVADLEVAFRLAKEKLPKNMNDVVNKNIARGFLMEAEEKKDSKKAWVLTATGEDYIENVLNK